MKTKIAAVLDKVSEIKRRLAIIMGVTHTQDDYAIYIKNIGGEIEKFLKDAVYENNNNNWNFYNLIKGLEPLGISAASTDKMHLLREFYNSLKHDPLYNTNILLAEERIDDLLSALHEIESKAIGRINENYIQANSRILWLCAWDDYIGGMTELNLFLPNYDLDFPYSVEYFNISLEGWDTLKDKFIPTGDLQLGKQFVSEKAYKVWSAGPDLIGVGRFTGDVKDLVKTLSSLVNKERESGLLEVLKRKNDSTSNFTSTAYAIQDTLLNDSWKDFNDFKDEIRLRIDFDYGIAVDSKVLDLYINKLNPEILSVDRNDLKNVNNLLWLSKDQYERESIRAIIMEKPYIALTTENKIIVKIT